MLGTIVIITTAITSQPYIHNPSLINSEILVHMITTELTQISVDMIRIKLVITTLHMITISLVIISAMITVDLTLTRMITTNPKTISVHMITTSLLVTAIEDSWTMIIQTKRITMIWSRLGNSIWIRTELSNSWEIRTHKRSIKIITINPSFINQACISRISSILTTVYWSSNVSEEGLCSMSSIRLAKGIVSSRGKNKLNIRSWTIRSKKTESWSNCLLKSYF